MLSRYLAFAFLLQQVCLANGVESNPHPVVEQTTDWVLWGKDEMEYVAISTDATVPGARIKSRVLLLNQSNSDIVVERISTTCGCTTATMKPSTLKPGDTGELNIEIATNQASRDLFDNFDVRVFTAGAIKEIRVRNVVRYVKFLGFSKSSYAFEYSKIAEDFEFKVPLVVAEAGLLDGCQVKLTDELARCDAMLIIEPEMAYVRLRGNPKAFEEYGVGEIRLTKHLEILASTQVILQGRSEIEIFPNVINFGVSSDGVHVATAILIDRGYSDTSQRALSKIECTADSAIEVPCSLQTIGKGKYRVRIQLKANENLPRTGTFKWSVLGGGETHNLVTKYVLR